MSLSRRDFMEKFGKGMLLASVSPSIVSLGHLLSPNIGKIVSKSMSLPEAAINRPSMISRAGWKCPEPNSSVNWPPEYREVQKIIVHHTVTSNYDSNPAATVRAIWYYHSVTLGWGDIGYNFLIDQQGNIYEGRYGGMNVVGGHAKAYNYGSVGVGLLGDYQASSVPGPMQDSLVRLLSWLSYAYGVNPISSGYFIDKALPNLMGHRDCMYTTCPGNQGYGILPAVRSKVWSSLPQYGVGWGKHTTPSILNTGQTVTVNVEVINRGTNTWNSGGQYPYRLGYHWYDEQGQQYVQVPREDYRSPLPTDLVMGQRTTVQAKLAAPRRPGNFTLKWDIVQEGVVWLNSLGESPLSVSVDVTGPVLPNPGAVQPRPGSLAFMAKPYWSPQSVGVLIANELQDSFSWTASVQGVSWLSASPLQGSSNSRMTVTMDQRGLGLGTYRGQIVINTTPSLEGSPYTIPVILYVVDQVNFGFHPDVDRNSGSD